MIPINRRPSVAELQKFSRIWLPLFVVTVGAIAWWRLDSLMAAVVAWGIGSAVIAMVLASREAARIVFVGLQVITYPIGLVVSSVALAFMFYVVFTPLGWTMRLLGRDPLRLRARREASHWVPYQQNDDPAKAFRQY